jgi:hypothetical protein
MNLPAIIILDIYGYWPKLKIVFGAYELWVPLSPYNYFNCDLSLDYTKYPEVGFRVLRLGCFQIRHRYKHSWTACKKCGYVYDVFKPMKRFCPFCSGMKNE